MRLVEPDAQKVRACVLNAVGRSAVAFPPPELEPEFRVVELTGTAADWEAGLNRAAGEANELIEIVEGRAIFRRG